MARSRAAASRSGSGLLDNLKWLLVALIAAAGIAANFVYSEQSLLYRMLAGLGIAFVAGLIALQTDQGRQFWELMRNARIEIRRVIWPSHQETVQTTLLVIGFVILVALLLWGVDWVLGKSAALLVG